MNGEDLPWLNGYPLRLVVPGYYGTYWVKHLNEIAVLDESIGNFWMTTAYRIPPRPACIEPGTVPSSTDADRSLRRSLVPHQPRRGRDGGEAATLVYAASPSMAARAFGGTVFSGDGRAWTVGELGADGGRYSFREWTANVSPDPGSYRCWFAAPIGSGRRRRLEPLWNPAGYMRNVVEVTNVIAA